MTKHGELNVCVRSLVSIVTSRHLFASVIVIHQVMLCTSEVGSERCDTPIDQCQA